MAERGPQKFLKSITYDIRVTRAGRIYYYRANITVGAPGSTCSPSSSGVLIGSAQAPPSP